MHSHLTGSPTLFPMYCACLAKASLTCITSTWGQGLRSANHKVFYFICQPPSSPLMCDWLKMPSVYILKP